MPAKPADPYKKAKAYFSPGRDCLEVTTGFFDRTLKNLDCAYFSITHPDVIVALISTVKRGVKGGDGGKPRLLVDKEQYNSIEMMRDGVKALAESGWEVRIDTESGFMHDKYAVSDYKTLRPAVITGSWNATKRATTRNRENLVRIRIKAVVKQYHDNFETIWTANGTVRAFSAPPMNIDSKPPEPPTAPPAPAGGNA